MIKYRPNSLRILVLDFRRGKKRDTGVDDSGSEEEKLSFSQWTPIINMTTRPFKYSGPPLKFLHLMGVGGKVERRKLVRLL